MTIHEFGREHPDTVVLLHPLGVWWDIFDRVIPLLERRWHVAVPAMPGHDPDQPRSHYTSVEQIAGELADWLQARNPGRIACLYGCSMGGGVVARMLAEGRVRPRCAVMDGGMTPYRLPRPLTWCIGVRDFVMAEAGKHMSLSAMRSVFDPDKYTQEDLQYVKNVLGGMSARSLWRGFYSANNYRMPSPVPPCPCPVQYWYGSGEKKARAWDIAYIRRAFPQAQFVENSGQDHAEFFTLHPEAFCGQLEGFIDRCAGKEAKQ